MEIDMSSGAPRNGLLTLSVSQTQLTGEDLPREVFCALISFLDTFLLRKCWEYSTPGFLEGMQWEMVLKALLGQIWTPSHFSVCPIALNSGPRNCPWGHLSSCHKGQVCVISLLSESLSHLTSQKPGSWLLDLNDFFPEKKEDPL